MHDYKSWMGLAAVAGLVTFPLMLGYVAWEIWQLLVISYDLFTL